MTKQEKIARVRYEPEGTNDQPEGFVLELKTEDGWGLVVRTNLRKSADYPDEEEKNFIHFTFMTKIFELIDLGYRVYRI